MPDKLVHSRFGTLAVEAGPDAITRLIWNAGPSIGPDALVAEALAQLAAYVDGRLTVFDLPLAPAGSPFQQRVYTAMRNIPYGQTRSYGDIATELAVPAQPVGQACGANPIPIIIPCHRVLAKSGIGGFSGHGGVEGKINLLKHENGFPFLL